jgi:hypothetical protein
MNVQVQDVYTGGYHNLKGESSTAVLLRSAVPFKIGNRDNIVRATLPIITESPSGESGLSNGTVFTLFESFTGKPVDLKYPGIINEQPFGRASCRTAKIRKNPL